MDDKDKWQERELGKSVLVARHDDDYYYLYIWYMPMFRMLYVSSEKYSLKEKFEIWKYS